MTILNDDLKSNAFRQQCTKEAVCVSVEARRTFKLLGSLLFFSPQTQSCHVKLIDLFSEKLYLIGLAALAVAVIMVGVAWRRQRPQLAVWLSVNCLPSAVMSIPCLDLNKIPINLKGVLYRHCWQASA